MKSWYTDNILNIEFFLDVKYSRDTNTTHYKPCSEEACTIPYRVDVQLYFVVRCMSNRISLSPITVPAWWARMASPITSLTIVYSTVYSGADQRKHQSSASLAFVRGIHRGPVQRPVTRSFDVFFDLRLNLRLNKRFNKQSWCWWFETSSCSLWRHCNDYKNIFVKNPHGCPLWRFVVINKTMNS